MERLSVRHPWIVRRTGLLVAGWALATSLALVLGLQGVRAISDSVTSHPKASLSPGSVRAALDRSSSSTDESSSSSDEASSLSSSVEQGPSSSSTADDRGQLPQVPSPGAQTASSGEPTPPSESSESAAQASEDQTFQLVGGSVGVRFENGEAHLLWATPNTGFSVDTSGSSSNVDVRFESDSHESRLKAFWNNGPQHEIEERATD
jgi:hypothetical protein